MLAIWRAMAYGTLAFSVKGREAELLVPCDLIGGNRWSLDIRSYCEATLPHRLRIFR